MKIALYKDAKYGSKIVMEVSDYMESKEGYIRVTDVVNVEFNMLSKDMLNIKEMAVIEKSIKNEMAESESRLNHLKQRKQDLLAIGLDE